MSFTSMIAFWLLMRVPYRLQGRRWRRLVRRFDDAAVRAWMDATLGGPAAGKGRQ